MPGPTQFPSVANTGATVFYSASSNFVAGGDLNGAWEVFAGVPSIFTDGFESGDIGFWTSSTP